MKRFIIFCLLFALSFQSEAQYYAVSFKRDVAPLAVGIGLTGLGRILHNRADGPSLAEIEMLDIEDLNFLDRGTVFNDSRQARAISDVILYSSAVMPFVTYVSHKCRANGGAIALMVVETALINNGITSITKSSVERYRPFNYDPATDNETRLGRTSRESFISGHTSNAAAFAFLSARIITDLHPDLKHKHLIWLTASTIPAVIGYLRVRGGRHFPTDVIAGYIVGAATGYLIPSLHLVKNEHVKLSTTGIAGLRLSINF
jgi:membrane-associated phospholipid phosphatase